MLPWVMNPVKGAGYPIGDCGCWEILERNIQRFCVFSFAILWFIKKIHRSSTISVDAEIVTFLSVAVL